MSDVKMETLVYYYREDEDKPYKTRIPVAPESVTLRDLKTTLKLRSQCKFFFKSEDKDFGLVKEEIVDDDSNLPLFNGHVVCYLEQAHGSSIVGGKTMGSSKSDVSDSVVSSHLPPPGLERGPGVGETRPPSFHGGRNVRQDFDSFADGETADSDVLTPSQVDDDFDTESSITSVSQAAENRRRRMGSKPARLPGPGIRPPGAIDSSSVLSSEIESSIYDTEDAQSMASSRFTTSTDHTSVSQQMHRRQRRIKRRVPAHLQRAGSISSVTDSTLSLNCITVTLNLDTVSFLGISIVGQSNKFGDGDCGIYVGSIMKGGAVALDGRIEPGDMILQVNDISFEDMSNDDAVRVLREVVQKPGPIKLVVAKCWDSAPSRNYFTVPRAEPVRPIDPGAWVAHTAAVRGEIPMGASHFVPPHPGLGDYPGRCESVTTLSASSVVSSQAETERYVPISNTPLTTKDGFGALIRAMQRSSSGVEVKDRTWAKITVKNCFLGSDVVDWLMHNVSDLSDRREAKKLVGQMFKSKFITSALNKNTFAEESYFRFGEEANLVAGLGNVTLSSTDSATPAPPAPTGPAPPVPWMPAMPGIDQGPPHGMWGHHEPSPMGGMSIYNPSAPPPSANYMAFGSSTYGPGNNGQPSVISSGGSGNSQPHLRLAGSGSGSESADSRGSKHKVHPGPEGSIVSSDGGFIAAMAARNQQSNPYPPQPAYKAHC